MANTERLCSSNFKIWAAFLVGMVVIVVAIVIFDKVLKTGRPLDGQGPSGSSSGSVADPIKAASFLSLKDSSEENGAWLGIDVVALPENAEEKLGHGLQGGVLVSRVVDGSPADKGGVIQGDIIYEFYHREIDSLETLKAIISDLDPGSRVKVVLIRDDKRKVLYIKLGETPSSSSNSALSQISGDAEGGDRIWGITISDLNTYLRKLLQIPENELGVVVLMVLPGSASHEAGVREGDLIQQIDRTPVRNLADFFHELSNERESALISIYRQGEILMVDIKGVMPINRYREITEEEKLITSPPDEKGPGFGTLTSLSLGDILDFFRTDKTTGINRPLYVPGYDTSQSKTLADSNTSRFNEKGWMISGNREVENIPENEEPCGEEAPVCKRITDLEEFL